MSIATQKNMVLAHLKSGKRINPIQALKLFRSFRLGARIYDLKQEGHNIERQMIEVETRDGTARVAEYRLAS
ncbi:MAG: helix-turn-helix domain-containing protein [Pikeienuella sp.]